MGRLIAFSTGRVQFLILAAAMLSIAFKDKLIYGSSIFLSRIINKGKDPKKIQFNKILIIRMDEIGDLCYSLPVFELLRKQYPEADITLWCKPFAIGLVANSPHLDHVTSDEKDLLKSYDLIVDLRGKWEGLMYAFRHQPKYRVERGIVRLRNKRKGKHPHQIQTDFEIIRDLLQEGAEIPAPRFYLDERDKNIAHQYIINHQLKKFAVFHTGARRELRLWPAGRFAQLAFELKKDYDLDIVFAGDKNDIASIDNIRQQISFPTFSIAGEFGLAAFAALTRHATIYIGNESGPLHIAAISNIPCIGLFGPGEPDVFYPLGEKAKVIHHVLSCNPCDQIHCVHPDNPCIKRITLEEVKEKIDELLNSEIITQK